MINYKKLKDDMDANGSFQIDHIISPDGQYPYEEILMIRTGADGEKDYRLTVETHVEYEDEYNVIEEFGSDLGEIEKAVNCFVNNGGKLENFDYYKI